MTAGSTPITPREATLSMKMDVNKIPNAPRRRTDLENSAWPSSSAPLDCMLPDFHGDDRHAEEETKWFLQPRPTETRGYATIDPNLPTLLSSSVATSAFRPIVVDARDEDSSRSALLVPAFRVSAVHPKTTKL